MNSLTKILLPPKLKVINYIKIIRPKNLILVALSQILIYLVYLFPLASMGTYVRLNGNLWILFVVDTVLIAAGGYIVNDLMDQKADAFNKPENIYIGSEKINPTIGWVFYTLVVLAGFGIAYYIGYKIGQLHLLTIYPVAVGLLFLYSSHLKRLPLIGNLVVSVFCAFVPGIIWYAEYDMLEFFVMFPNNWYLLLMHLFPVYIAFAFLSTFVREIIKDIEDIDGDRKSSFRTLPIMAGVERAKMVALFFGIILLCSYPFWFFGFSRPEEIVLDVIIFVALILPTVYILNKIYNARSKEHFTSISKMLKYLMIVSLFLFLCIPYIPFILY